MIVGGFLVSENGKEFPIVNGIPRFVDDQNRTSVESFGDEWNFFNFLSFKSQWLNHTVKNTFGSSKVFKDKIIVDEFYQTNIPGYFAIGDVTSGQALAHVASAEGILCVEKIANHDVEPIDYDNIPGCTYCAPEVASVGLTEEKALEKGYSLKIGKFPFTASGKAQASGHSGGFVKVIFDEKYGEWLGCHMIGAGVTDMIAEAVLGRKLETTGKEILKSVHPHPTMSEALMEAVAAAYDEVIHL
jgi:dihydrolipoamide dehydrogenase